MTGLDFVLDRSVTIAARRETVFRYFTDSERFAAWWGAGSRIEPRPGGAVEIRFPNAIVAGGEVLEIAPPERIVFSYGFASGQPIPKGASRVTIRLEETARGTLVKLVHELPNAEVRDEHVQGWRYQLAVFANVVAREAHADAGSLADRFFACWGETDAAQRRAALAALAAPDLSRQCQGTALVDWTVAGPDGSERAKGTHVFELTPDGRVARVTGLWG